jgi:sugar-specific transcriptional regulator TrmB
MDHVPGRNDEKQALEALQALGISQYEARLYVGLLQGGPQNGNELSKTTGVPSSKVYAILDKLAAAGVVQHVQRNNTTEYVCIPPDELVDRLRVRFNEPLEKLALLLPTLRTEQPDPEILAISNWSAIRDHARRVIGEAKDEIYVSAWSENVAELEPDFAAADARGVRIFSMIYGEAPLDVGSSLTHSYQEIVASRIGGHMLILVADSQEALIAQIPERGDPLAVRTRNPVLSLITQEYMRHDIVLQKAKSLTGFDEWDRWWQADPDVRMVMLGRSLDNGGRPRTTRRRTRQPSS